MPSNLDHIIAIGKSLYGERWQRRVADDIDVDEKTVRMWISGELRPSERHVRILRSTAKERVLALRAVLSSIYGDHDQDE